MDLSRSWSWWEFSSVSVGLKHSHSTELELWQGRRALGFMVVIEIAAGQCS